MKILESISIDLEAPVRLGFAAKGCRHYLCGVVLVLGVLLAGCGGDEGVLDPDPNSPISLESQVRASGVSAEQVVIGGIPQRQSRLRIPFIGDVSVNGCSACRFEALVRNPLTDVEELREIRIDNLAVDGSDPNVLIAWVAGPAPAGSVFGVSDSTLSVGGEPVEAGSITFTGLALSPTEAALWFKAFVPTDPEVFPSSIYDNTPAVNSPQPTDPDVVRADLNAHYQHYIDAGILSPDEVGALLARFDNPDDRLVFTDSTGTFEPQLMAMVLATAGTVGEFAIETLIDGQNQTGVPAVVFYDPRRPVNEIARVEVVHGQYQVQVNERARNQPFEAFSASIAHETVHQDNEIGQDEEIVGKGVEIDVWRQHLLVNPELASSLTALPRFNNLQLLMRLNSGRNGYPRSGLLQAPLAQDPSDVVQLSPALDPVSLEDFLRNNVYLNTPVADTPGNEMLDRYISVISTTPQSGLGFNNVPLEFIDNPALFTPEEDFRILQILRLQLSDVPAE